MEKKTNKQTKNAHVQIDTALATQSKAHRRLTESGQDFFVVDERHVEEEAGEDEAQRVDVAQLRVGRDRRHHQQSRDHHHDDRDDDRHLEQRRDAALYWNTHRRGGGDRGGVP